MEKMAHLYLATFLIVLATFSAGATAASTQWSTEKAGAWRRDHPWLVGCNFSPSNAINQLEMWQADSFDPATIDRELGWAEDLGFNGVRVFLHHLLWEQDSKGFMDRMEKFLDIADKHHIGVMFVLFDSVWDPHPKLGKQHAPQSGLHNSGWVQSPGIDVLTDPARSAKLDRYVKGVIGHFRNDRRVHLWDLYNEPDNQNDTSYGKKNKNEEPADKVERSLDLLKKTFAWAREADPSQPLSSGVWIGATVAAPGPFDPAKLSPTERAQLEMSDVITFHTYGQLDEVKHWVRNLRTFNRPLVCTEYMARPRGGTFNPILAYFKQEKIGAYNWGFVAGKTNTIYPWDSWQTPYPAEPKIWFHDIFRADGTSFDPKEVKYIKRVTGAAKQQ